MKWRPVDRVRYENTSHPLLHSPHLTVKFCGSSQPWTIERLNIMSFVCASHIASVCPVADREGRGCNGCTCTPLGQDGQKVIAINGQRPTSTSNTSEMIAIVSMLEHMWLDLLHNEIHDPSGGQRSHLG